MHTGAEAYSTRARFWPPVAAAVAGASFSAPLPGPVRARRHHTDDVQTTRQQAAYSQASCTLVYGGCGHLLYLAVGCLCGVALHVRAVHAPSGGLEEENHELPVGEAGGHVRTGRSRTSPSSAAISLSKSASSASRSAMLNPRAPALPLPCLPRLETRASFPSIGGAEGCCGDQRGRRGSGGGTQTCPEA